MTHIAIVNRELNNLELVVPILGILFKESYGGGRNSFVSVYLNDIFVRNVYAEEKGGIGGTLDDNFKLLSKFKTLDGSYEIDLIFVKDSNANTYKLFFLYRPVKITESYDISISKIINPVVYEVSKSFNLGFAGEDTSEILYVSLT